MKEDKEVLVEIRKEHQIVSARLQKLEEFMISDDYRRLPYYMRELMVEQRDGMRTYCNALFTRIRYMLTDTAECPKEDDGGNCGFLL